jgi:L-ribulose-5-phosphate 3-epimerase
MTLRKAARLRMSEGETLQERCDLVAEVGFEGVDIPTPTDLDVPALAEAARNAGLEISNVMAASSLRWYLADPDPAVREQGRQGLETSLRDAASVGATSVLLPTLLATGADPEAGREHTREELERVLPLAGGLEVRVALENNWNSFLTSAEELAAFVDGFESLWIVVHYDTGNAQVIGPAAEWVDALGPRIHKVDLKDYSHKAADGDPDRGQAIELGEGEVDWGAVGAALRRIGYDGWVSAETPGSGREFLERTFAAMDAVAA